MRTAYVRKTANAGVRVTRFRTMCAAPVDSREVSTALSPATTGAMTMKETASQSMVQIRSPRHCIPRWVIAVMSTVAAMAAATATSPYLPT